MKHRSAGDLLFESVNALLMLLLIVVTVYPLYYVVIASFTDPTEMIKHTGLLLYPPKFSLASYQAVLEYKRIYTGFRNTLLYMGIGTVVNMILTILGGYALSRKDVVGIGGIMKLITLTMFFGGGLIPTFLLVKGLGMFNSMWAVILPGAISTMNLIIMRTAFLALPGELEESARLDGANDLVILFHICVPLCMPTIAVLILYYSVGHWNSFFDAMIYLQDQYKHPLQLVLRSLLITNSSDGMGAGAGDAGDQINLVEVLKYAVIIVSTVPILCVYPFLQKYFTKGVMIGAVKG